MVAKCIFKCIGISVGASLKVSLSPLLISNADLAHREEEKHSINPRNKTLHFPLQDHLIDLKKRSTLKESVTPYMLGLIYCILFPRPVGRGLETILWHAQPQTLFSLLQQPSSSHSWHGGWWDGRLASQALSEKFE